MWYFRGLHQRFADFLSLGLPPGRARVLDAGCGAGGFIRRTQPMRPEWEFTGIDIMPQACVLARQRTAARIVEGSITSLPFAAGEFDAVVSGDVVCQVGDDAAALRELARCVRPGGVVAVNVPAFRWLWSYHDQACETLRRYTQREVAALFMQAGLAVRLASYANAVPFLFIVLRRKILRRQDRASDLHLYPRPVEDAFTRVASVENAWLRQGRSLPVGSSVFVVGQKSAY